VIAVAAALPEPYKSCAARMVVSRATANVALDGISDTKAR